MRYVVIGPGALGSLFGALLAKSFSAGDNQLWLLDHNPTRAENLKREGLLYEKNNRLEHIAVQTCCSALEIDRADVILVCVKSYDVTACLNRWQCLLQEGTLVIFLQNGIGHLHMDQHTDAATPVFATCSEGATLVAKGHIRHCGSGTTSLGFLDQTTTHFNSLLNEVCNCLNQCGLHSTVSDNILPQVWAKLFINVGINALTAIHQVPNGRLLESPDTVRMMTAAIDEAHQVAEASNIAIMEDPLRATLKVCQATGANISSMLQDIRKMRRTEIEAINGFIVTEGKRLGIDTPTNLQLVAKIKAIEMAYQNK